MTVTAGAELSSLNLFLAGLVVAAPLAALVLLAAPPRTAAETPAPSCDALFAVVGEAPSAGVYSQFKARCGPWLKTRMEAAGDRLRDCQARSTSCEDEKTEVNKNAFAIAKLRAVPKPPGDAETDRAFDAMVGPPSPASQVAPPPAQPPAPLLTPAAQ